MSLISKKKQKGKRVNERSTKKISGQEMSTGRNGLFGWRDGKKSRSMLTSILDSSWLVAIVVGWLWEKTRASKKKKQFIQHVNIIFLRIIKKIFRNYLDLRNECKFLLPLPFCNSNTHTHTQVCEKYQFRRIIKIILNIGNHIIQTTSSCIVSMFFNPIINSK